MKVVTLPEKILREKSHDVDLKNTSVFHDYLKELIATMYDYNGIGIAAVQVGDLKRIVIIDTDNGPMPLLNPLIVRFSREEETNEEGCLSVPGKFGNVRRAKKVTVAAFDAKGKKVKFTASGLFARVVQHELIIPMAFSILID